MFFTHDAAASAVDHSLSCAPVASSGLNEGHHAALHVLSLVPSCRGCWDVSNRPPWTICTASQLTTGLPQALQVLSKCRSHASAFDFSR